MAHEPSHLDLQCLPKPLFKFVVKNLKTAVYVSDKNRVKFICLTKKRFKFMNEKTEDNNLCICV